MYSFLPYERVQLGVTGLKVSRLCIGGGPLGSMPELFGHDTPADQAIKTVLATFDSDLNFLDTSAGYSNGESERRIGAAIAQLGQLPEGFVLASKVDPDPETEEFDGAAVRRSLEGSLERLGVDHLPLLYLHDPEKISFEAGIAPDGPVAELVRMRDEGLVHHLGVAGGPVGNLLQYLRTGEFEVVLTHNRYTLLDRSAEPLLQWADTHGIGVVQGAPFGGGVLAKGTKAHSTYAYSVMNAQTQASASALSAVCAETGVPLGAAALQFPLRDPRIAAVVVGVSRPERIQQSIDWATFEISDDDWEQILTKAGISADLDNTTR